MKTRKMSVLLYLSLLLSAAVSRADEILSRWDYQTCDQIQLGDQNGCEATKSIPADVKTPAGENCLQVDLLKTPPSASYWSVQLKYDYRKGLKKSERYKLSFMCRASRPGELKFVCALNRKPWSRIPGSQKTIKIGTTWQAISVVFSADKDYDGPLALPRFMLARFGDHAKLYFGPLTLTSSTSGAAATDNLFFNSSFELGTDGFRTLKYLRPETNPKLVFEEAVIDESTRVSGKQSLRIPNRFAEETLVYPWEAKLSPKTSYHFSIWMKAGADRLSVNTWICNRRWRGGMANFTIGRDWKRYSFSFTSKDYAATEDNYYHLALRFCRGANEPAADIWLDDLQLTTDPNRSFKAAADLELSVRTDKTHQSEDGKANVPVENRLINNTDAPVETTLTLEVFDEYRNKRVFSRTLPVALPPRGVKSLPATVPVTRFGVYRVAPRFSTSPSSKVLPNVFAVIGNYQNRPLDLNQNFCVGLVENCGMISDRRIKYGWETLGGVQRDQYAALLNQMGCRLIRDFGGFRWVDIESEQGTYDFRFTDQLVNTYRDNNIELMPILGFFRFMDATHFNNRLPDWLMPLCTKKEIWLDGHHSKDKASIRKKYHMTLPPEELWRGYLRAIGERYRGKLSHYEIMNEPNLKISPQDYMSYLKPAAETLRAANPTCSIVGFCVTGDLAGAGKSAEYLEPCFKNDGLKHADILSFHPYDSRQLSSPRPADTMIATYKSLIEKYRGDTPIWNTELFFLSDGSSDDFNLPQAAKRFLIDLGEGVGQSTSIPVRRVFQPRLLKNSYIHPNRHYIECIPSPVYVMYNALARMFEGARPVEKIRWPGDCVCYVYERDGKYCAAIWKYGQTDNLTMTLSFDETQATLYDLFGNNLALDGQPLPLKEEPYYVVFKGGKNQWKRRKIIATLRKPPVRGRFADTITPRRILPTADGLSTVVDISNFSPEPLSGQAEVIADRSTDAVPATYKIAPYTTKQVRISTTFAAGRLPKQTLLKVTANHKTIEKALTVPDIAVAETSPGKRVSLKRKSWYRPPPQQTSAEFKVWHDAENIHFKVFVNDATPSGAPNGRHTWQQDSVEFFIDTRPDQLTGSLEQARRYNTKTAIIAYAPYETTGKKLTIGSKLPRLTAKAIKTVCTPSKAGYVLELAIPFKALGLKAGGRGQAIGFDLGVNDANGAQKSAAQLTWSTWGKHYKDRLSLGIVKFD
jgi:hypothetical protein